MFFSRFIIDDIVKIFERLHPIELYNLIRTTKSIRKLLLNQEAWSIWHRSYAKHKEVPSCPSDTSYPRWTTLLFGPDDCDVSCLCTFDDLETEENIYQKCGANYAMPDFAFRAHFCESCMVYLPISPSSKCGS